MRKWIRVLAAGLLGLVTQAIANPSACDSVADNLVQNCGFENGTASGWTYTAGTDPWFMVRGVPGDPHSGNYGALFGAMGTDDSLSQVLATTAGANYTISFWLSNHWSDPGGADFHVYWNGTDLFDASSLAFNYTQFTFSVIGTGSDTLMFKGRQFSSIYRLDDVVVVDPVPEPASGFFAILTLAVLALGARQFARGTYVRRKCALVVARTSGCKSAS